MIKPDNPVKRTVTRQPDAAKREAILDGAWTSFLEHGLDRTTVEGVAAATGVSKVTVYKHFPDKEALFDAVVRRQMDFIQSARIAETAHDGTIAERLLAFGNSLMRFLLSADAIQFDATLTRDLRRHPALAQLFWEAGPARGLATLQAILADAAARGELIVDDVAEAAEDLIGLWHGMTHNRAILSLAPPGPDLGRVQRGVILFLRLYQIDPSAAQSVSGERGKSRVQDV